MSSLRVPLLLLLLLPTLALAGSSKDEPRRLGALERGVWMGDNYRYDRFQGFTGLVARIGMDLVSIPTGMVSWDAGDWALLVGETGLAVALSIPVNGVPYDVRIQRRVRVAYGGSEGPHIWQPYGDFLIFSGAASLTLGFLLYGAFDGHPEFVEVSTLMIEAFAVTEIIHVTLKFFTGRAGTNSLGQYEGPAGFFKYFPSGTPSGHIASIAGVLAALSTYYWDVPVLNIALTSLTLLLGAAIVTDDYHFLSEAVLGTTLGLSVGRWVAHHRSTRFRGPEAKKAQPELSLVPSLMGQGGAGLNAVVVF